MIGEMERELAAEREAKEAAEKAAQEGEDQYNQLAAEFDDLQHTMEETRSALQVRPSEIISQDYQICLRYRFVQYLRGFP